MFAGKTLVESLKLAMASIKNAHAFIAYARTNKAHKVRWVRAADALERKDFDRVKAYMSSGEERTAAWEAVKAKEAPKPAQAKPAPKAKPAKPAPSKAKPAQAAPAQGLSDADVLRIAQLVASMLTGGKKVA